MLRKAVAADEAAVRLCAEETYRPYVSAIGRNPAPMIADFQFQISMGWVHVIGHPGEAVDGFIVYYQRQNHMFLENVAVRPEFAGKGLGKTLIEHCERQARQRGLAAVRLYTNEKMTDNLSIYPHLGYVETDRRQEAGFNRVYFEKRLLQTP